MLLAQADEVADLAELEAGMCAAFVHSLGLPDLKAKKLLKALGVARGEVRAATTAAITRVRRRSGGAAGGTDRRRSRAHGRSDRA